MPEPTKDLLTNQMKTLARQPNTPIRYVLNELHAIAKIYYHDKEPAEAAVLTNRFMIQGLCNFTTGQTRQTLVSSIEFAQAYDKPLDWERLLESITYSERIHGFPQQILSFNPQSTNALSVFHNHLSPISIPEIPVPQPVFEPFMPLYDDTDDSTKTNHSRNTFAPMPVSMPRRPQPVHQIQQPFQNYIPPIQPQNHIPQPQQQPIRTTIPTATHSTTTTTTSTTSTTTATTSSSTAITACTQHTTTPNFTSKCTPLSYTSKKSKQITRKRIT
jgi:hypothetical protein